ncbi:MAG TPA: DegT/DnrJ/EryC1/StrS family aminotransferase [Actinomycetota bacterium]|nr:DegT/DnrJ/EryC1/StrS family aminotransferase [Actinomycetota bacterium]
MSYRSPFVDLPTHWQNLRDELLPVIEDVLGRGQVIMRDELARFEEEIAAFCGTRFAIGLNSCTDGMFLALKAAGVGDGHEVITVGHTFVATIAAIVHNGARPVLVDVNLDDHLMDVGALERALTPRTKAIIPVHLNGRICDMDRLVSLADEHGLVIVEDAAQALGATYRGSKAGSFGAAGCFSLYPMKLLGAYGDGGALVTDDEELYKRIRMYRDHGQNRTTGEVWDYGFNSRLDNVQAAILSVKLRHLPEWLERRRELAARYKQGLSELPEIVLPLGIGEDAERYDVFQNFVIRAPERDSLAKHLEENGVETLISWPVPTHHHSNLGLSQFDLPNTEELSRSVLSLPMNAEVTDEQVDYTVSQIKSFYR